MTTPIPPASPSLASAVLPSASSSDIRDELTAMVRNDLLGPAAGPSEELPQREDHVYGRYLVGMLAPKSSEVDPGQITELSTGDGDEGEEGNADSGVPAGSTYFPSSMGISFVVAAEATELVVDAEWGHYLRIKSETQVKKDGNPTTTWKRNPVTADPLTFQLQDGVIKPQPWHPAHPLVILQGRMRHTPMAGS